jgi:tetratricopeptide (TPR) repeat protein
LALEEQIPITKEKLALLRMAREQIDHALEQSPNHQEAQRTGEEIDRRMAQVHEDEGDFQEQQSAFSQPEQQAMQLSQALDHFQQASELRPNQPRLQAKQEQAEQKLAQTLDKLADKLMQSPGAQEPMEAKAARLEGAEQALNELQAIKPSDRTAQRAEQVGKELDGLRQMLAEKGQKPSESPGQGDPRNGAQPMPAPPQWMAPPLDGPPRINQPGNKGQAPKSAGRNIRDY